MRKEWMDLFGTAILPTPKVGVFVEAMENGTLEVFGPGACGMVREVSERNPGVWVKVRA